MPEKQVDNIVPRNQEERDNLKPTAPWDNATAIEESAYRTGYDAARRLVENQDLKVQVAELEHRATHDALTGLLNKEALTKDIETRIAKGEAFGVAFIDFDKFKRVNDTLGHEVADKQLLKAFGEFLTDRFRRKDDVLSHEQLIYSADEHESGTAAGRYGGDEIGIVFGLRTSGHRAMTTAEALDKESTYVRRVVKDFVGSLSPEILNLDFNMAVGISYWEPAMGTATASKLINQADENMRADKMSQRTAYTPEQQQAIEDAKAKLASQGLTLRDIY